MKDIRMRKRIEEKLLETVLMVFIVSFLLFSVFYFLKGESSSVILSEDVTEDVRAHYSSRDEGFIMSFLLEMRAFFLLDWGESLSGESVKTIVFTSLPITLSLTLFSFLLSFPFSLFISIRTGGKKSGFVDALSSLFLLVPTFLSSIILILVFSSLLHIFPVAGYKRLSSGFFEHLSTVFLPSLSLSFLSSAFLLRLFREGIAETMKMNYITYTRAKGMKEKSIVLKAALKPTLPLIITSSAEAVISTYASSTVVETVFALPGMGRALVKSALERDYSLSFVLVMISIAIISIILFISNLLIAFVDKRSGRENGKV